jgi:hypothetical protein
MMREESARLWRLGALLIVLLSTVPNVGFASSRLDGASKSMVFLAGPPKIGEDGQVRRPTGSGFFIINGAALLLVTAEHVARGLTGGALAVIQGPDGKGLEISLDRLAGARSSWRYHQTADLAVLCISTAQASNPILKGRFLPVNMIRSEASAPSRAITLTVFGFPLALGITGEFSPISRETRPASGLITTNRGDTKTPAVFFVTQDPSIGGFSGAPVFDTGLPYSTSDAAIQIDGRPIQIVGVAHGTVPDDTGGKLGLITPAHLLAELLSTQQCAP